MDELVFHHAARMPINDKTLIAISDLWTEEYVFESVDPRLRSFFGMHKLFSMMESGFFRVYGAFDAESRFMGCIFGNLHDDNESFIMHLAFYRNTRVITCMDGFRDAILADFARDGVAIKYFVGLIPETHWAAIRLAKRGGMEDRGFCEETVPGGNGETVRCRKLVGKAEVVHGRRSIKI